MTPSLENAVLHEQVKFPGLFEQVALESQLSALSAQLSWSAHVIPSPENPARDTIACASVIPMLFKQVALESQLPVLSVHSSSFVHVTSSPKKPALHVQVKLPGLFEQLALESQSSVSSAHASSSVHVTSTPENPVLHSHASEIPWVVGANCIGIAIVCTKCTFIIFCARDTVA